MDAVLDRALSLRGVTGVLVLTPDSWLTIASRGALSSTDAKPIADLISWTNEGSTGSVPWQEGAGGRCLHFHRASTHTLILLRRSGMHRSQGQVSQVSGSSGWSPRAPRMHFGLSSLSTVSATSAISAVTKSSDRLTIRGFEIGSASMYAPSCSCSLTTDVVETHRPSSWY